MTKVKEANKLHPFRPGYVGPTRGLFFLIHHAVLLEWSDDITERGPYIREYKPENERESRLWHITYVPDERLPKYLRDAAYAKYVAAYAKYVAASAEYYDASAKLDAAYAKYVAASAEYYAASAEYYAARDKWIDSGAALKLLDELCPGHRWNGSEIVF